MNSDINNLIYKFERTTTEGDADIMLAREILRTYPTELRDAFQSSEVFSKWARKNATRVQAWRDAELEKARTTQEFKLEQEEDERMQVAIAFGSFDKYPNPPKDRAGTTKLPDYMVNRNAYTPVDIDPVVRQMYEVLKGISWPSEKTKAAIAAAEKHFKWLTSAALIVKEQIVAETFPGIWRETWALVDTYTTAEWTAMIDVLYLKALDSRRKNEVNASRAEVPAGAGEPVKGTRIISGNIAPIEAAFLKNLGK